MWCFSLTATPRAWSHRRCFSCITCWAWPTRLRHAQLGVTLSAIPGAKAVPRLRGEGLPGCFAVPAQLRSASKTTMVPSPDKDPAWQDTQYWQNPHLFCSPAAAHQSLCVFLSSQSPKDPLRSQGSDMKFSGFCEHPLCIRIAVKKQELQWTSYRSTNPFPLRSVCYFYLIESDLLTEHFSPNTQSADSNLSRLRAECAAQRKQRGRPHYWTVRTNSINHRLQVKAHH